MPDFKVILAALAACATVWLTCSPAHAALTVSSTRVIQYSDKHNTSVVVANPSGGTYAAQVWVNTEADDLTTAVPLMASPALFQLTPQGEQTVQINRLPNDLPNDRESLFFFNVQEIPQVEQGTKNALTIALRTRIKVFYRPAELEGSPADRLDALSWSMRLVDGQHHLIVDNPTPFYFTFGKLVVTDQGRQERVDAKAMAIPKGSQAYALEQPPTGAEITVVYTTINDYGGRSAEKSVVVPIPGR